jgi:hypothetical protein
MKKNVAHYKYEFANEYLRIEVHSNSARIHTLIKNFLDLPDRPRFTTSQVKINFNLNESSWRASNNKKDIISYNKLDEEGNLFSSMGNSLINTEVKPKAGLVSVHISDYERLPKENILYSIFVRPLHFILAYYGLFFLHVSAVCKGRDCIIISGCQDSGKTTLALLLSQNGFDFLSDDDCFVKLKGHQTQIFPFPTKIGLNDKFLKRYPEFDKFILKNYRYGSKNRFSSNAISSRSYSKDLRCRMIIFPKYRTNSDIQIKKISQQYAFNTLMSEKVGTYTKLESRNRFWTLLNLTRNTSSYELTYNDRYFKKIPEVISKIFYTALKIKYDSADR